ncbi:DnaJ-like cysteine-rich domain-containing protein [Streptomyces leeuwenhoekii]|nr:zinc finger-like domain-containing protein [Streptomyces leeuwenhoekii]
MLTLRVQQMTIDGNPYLCPECLSEAFTLDGTGFIDALPVRGNCWQSHSWEEPMITLGVLKEINSVRTGREKAEDIDTFEITIGGAHLAGILQPEVTVDDIRQVVKRVYWQRIVKPGLRRRKNAAKRAIVRPIKRGTRNAVAAAQAAALEAAWTAQAGGYEPDPDHTPEPINPCPACKGKGEHRIESRLHDTTRVRCSVCLGTGEID